MKIALISHAYLETGYRYALDALAQHPGVELAWFTPERYRLALQNSSGDLGERSNLYRTYALPIRWGGRQGTFCYHTRALAEALEGFEPDVILHEQEVFAIGGGQVAYMAAQRKIPLAMFVNENVYRRLAAPRRWLRRYVMDRCAGLVAVTHGTAKVHRDWGYGGPIAALIQIGLRVGAEPALGRRGAGGLQICYAGRLAPEKGVDCLLRALAILREQHVNFKCVLAGRGELSEELKALSAQLGLGASVEFAGMLPPEAMAELLRRSDALVLPSRRTPRWEEQLGRVLLEAMAQATVPAGSRTGAIPEVIGSEELLFDEDDAHGLARVLQRLATDDVFLRAQQRRAWERVRDEYELKSVTARKVEFLREIASGRSQSAGRS